MSIEERLLLPFLDDRRPVSMPGDELTLRVRQDFTAPTPTLLRFGHSGDGVVEPDLEWGFFREEVGEVHDTLPQVKIFRSNLSAHRKSPDLAGHRPKFIHGFFIDHD